jgi:hypothetical protein
VLKENESFDSVPKTGNECESTVDANAPVDNMNSAIIFFINPPQD